METGLKSLKIVTVIFGLLMVSCGESETDSENATGTNQTTSVQPQGSSNSYTSSSASTETECTVSFLVNGNIYYSVNVKKGEIIVPPQDPSIIGYKFLKWLNKDGTDWDKNAPITNDNKTIIAQFEYDFLEIPAIIINTENNQPITSKTDYVPSEISLKNAKAEWEFDNIPAGIRGRGNSTWNLDKKPYRIKFEQKQSLFGSKKAKSWALIANHSDKTLLRNYMAYELGERFDGIDFSSMHQPVDLYLNNEYCGVYLLCDQIQTGKGRVNIDESISADGNNGYLIERDGHVAEDDTHILNKDYFVLDDLQYVIKTPDTDSETYIENKDVQINFIKNYFDTCFKAINNESWATVESLIDVDSFVDSYFIEELFAISDCGFSSCYFFKDKNGKLFKGPLWDFDTGAGNLNYNVGNAEQCLPNSSLYASYANVWYGALLKRDEFVNLLKTKLVSYRPILEEMFEMLEIDSETSLYKKYKNAFERNFLRWDIMGKFVWPQPNNVVSIATIKGQLGFMNSWLKSRYLYLRDIYLD